MKKLYVVCTTGILLIIFIHMFYMVGSLSSGGEINEDFAMNLGYILMYLSILHGIYGFVKWCKMIYTQRKLKKLKEYRTSKTITSAKAITMLQRISGLIVVLLVVPHTAIKLEMAPAILVIIDVMFVLSLIVHLLIGIPKWLVSAGLLSRSVENRFSVFYGGKKKCVK